MRLEGGLRKTGAPLARILARLLRFRGEEGTELVEFAIVVPGLMIVLTGVASFALAFYSLQQLGNATTTAVQLGCRSRTGQRSVRDSPVIGSVNPSQLDSREIQLRDVGRFHKRNNHLQFNLLRWEYDLQLHGGGVGDKWRGCGPDGGERTGSAEGHVSIQLAAHHALQPDDEQYRVDRVSDTRMKDVKKEECGRGSKAQRLQADAEGRWLMVGRHGRCSDEG